MIVMVAGDALADEQDRLHKASVTDESIFRCAPQSPHLFGLLPGYRAQLHCKSIFQSAVCTKRGGIASSTSNVKTCLEQPKLPQSLIPKP